MLEIKNLHARVDEAEILKGIDLSVGAGEVHAIMGPNGSGKSTLAYALAGHPNYEITGGSVEIDGAELNELDPNERARLGIFLAFQYPVTIPGVKVADFLRHAVSNIRTPERKEGEALVGMREFRRELRSRMEELGMDTEFARRYLNDGFSGGEKKRNEVFQMAVLDPKLAVLDETDSGLDIDALKIVADGVNALRDEGRSFVVITHYQRLLDYIVPDRVHVLHQGRIVRSGDKALALELEERGYGWLEEQMAGQS